MRIQIIAIAGSLLIAGFIFELIRKRKLLERYSLLWFGSALVMIVLSIWRGLLDKAAALMGVYYAPSALFIVALGCGVVLFVHFTIVISGLTEQNKLLAQEVGLMREELQWIRQRLAQGGEKIKGMDAGEKRV
ncbi:MAG: DUF2304 domain-containing protein [candidate division KSB1 bacterium]|nr:DUF2304 domain-containing protein [candidate division KSB1 bacterium]